MTNILKSIDTFVEASRPAFRNESPGSMATHQLNLEKIMTRIEESVDGVRQ